MDAGIAGSGHTQVNVNVGIPGKMVTGRLRDNGNTKITILVRDKEESGCLDLYYIKYCKNIIKYMY